MVLAKSDVPLKGIRWFGLSIGGGIWRSRNPKIISNNIYEYSKKYKIKIEDISSIILGLCGYLDSVEKSKELSKDAFIALSKENEKLKKELDQIGSLIKNPNIDHADVVVKIDKAVDNEVKSYISAIRKIPESGGDIISKVVLKIQERNKDRKDRRRKELKICEK